MTGKSTEKRISFFSPVTELSGVGQKRAEQLSRLGVKTVGELIALFPRAYQNRGNVHLIKDCDPSVACSTELTVCSTPKSAKIRGGMTVTRFSACDDSGKVNVCYFNNRFVEKTFEIGQNWRFWGKIKDKTLTNPDRERIYDGCVLPPFKAVYPLSSGLTQSFISDLIASALAVDGICEELVPETLRVKFSLPEVKTAYAYIHFPQNAEEVEIGRRYFALRDIFLFALSVCSLRNSKKKGVKQPMKETDMKPFFDRLGFKPTKAQSRSVREISEDMINGDAPMSRLLSGDVGSGKTAVAAASMYLCVKNGYQACLMAPTDILARQHYANLKPFFADLGISVALLTGSLREAEKFKIRYALARGDIDIVIGTHALLTGDTVFDKPGLVITDEQHRFGVSQRALLGENPEGPTPHVLVMSATPIPRTMGLIMFGELGVSTLDELPPGRKPVTTYSVDFTYKERLINFIKKTVSEGGQVYIVCPSIEPKEKDDEDLYYGGEVDEGLELCSATETYEELKENLGIPVGLVHGRMKPDEKDAAMEDFSGGKTKVLVSTTVIEVGVDVKSATLMIILNAERFGLAQLHQLRGRVGRNDRQSYCVLVSDTKTKTALDRLDVMTKTNDGYKIAEADLAQRGPGDYLPSSDGSARQHGDFNGVMSADVNVLKAAFDYARNMLEDDAELERYPTLKKAVLATAERNARSLQ